MHLVNHLLLSSILTRASLTCSSEGAPAVKIKRNFVAWGSTPQGGRTNTNYCDITLYNKPDFQGDSVHGQIEASYGGIDSCTYFKDCIPGEGIEVKTPNCFCYFGYDDRKGKNNNCRFKLFLDEIHPPGSKEIKGTVSSILCAWYPDPKAEGDRAEGDIKDRTIIPFNSQNPKSESEWKRELTTDNEKPKPGLPCWRITGCGTPGSGVGSIVKRAWLSLFSRDGRSDDNKPTKPKPNTPCWHLVGCPTPGKTKTDGVEEHAVERQW
ncbi:hypothetical protein BCR34DRAFT_591255 [Clohesyomyces aquaticus]|uniref:Uncharacterized protein n=1 Tax=Clohesyomyces aquaticus TaxID=1231657 RepID=A0A1Y1Z253_9PLEO|nr:hypothetical protein BCR34DRAFT_591255 [Clohesyomyces aquaticus]